MARKRAASGRTSGGASGRSSGRSTGRSTRGRATAEELPRERNCGTMIVHERLLRTDPSYAAARADSENRAWQAELSRSPLVGRSGVTVIPVVVHVVYRTAQENISEAQIKSQIDVLNRDFRKTNPDVSATPAVFAPFAADARIEFELATKDPNGNATNGITRTQTTKTGFTDNNDVKKASTGGADAWPADRYLNLWVCKLSGTLLGYAQFPGGPAATDGVVITHTAFGTTGTAAAPFNLGRTATHEIGHWLNLRHIWGDDGNGCNGDDFIADTPNCAGANTGMPTFPHITCNNGPNGDMFMNYMDYTDDAGMFMFSGGQVTRMQACLDADRSTIGHPKAGVPTLKFRDDQGGPTLKIGDDGGTIKVLDDGGGTLKFRDDGGTLKFVDDGGAPTLKPRDDGGTLKFRDDIKQPVLEKNPAADVKLPATDVGVPFDPSQPVTLPGGLGAGPLGGPLGGPGRGAPFVLASPHHSMAWTQSFPGAAQDARSAAEMQLMQYEQLFEQYAAAESAGQLGPEDYTTAEQLYAEYTQLVEEYQQLAGG